MTTFMTAVRFSRTIYSISHWYVWTILLCSVSNIRFWQVPTTIWNSSGTTFKGGL